MANHIVYVESSDVDEEFVCDALITHADFTYDTSHRENATERFVEKMITMAEENGQLDGLKYFAVKLVDSLRSPG